MARKELEKMSIKVTDMYEIGAKIRDRRIALGLSQDDLADMVGSDGNSISRHENGTREMKITQFCQYAEALCDDPADLLPDRLTKKPTGTHEKLMRAASSLSEEELRCLLYLAERLKRSE